MELFLDGIGIIKDSQIKLDGLTVISGNNNSGKTTVGKALYAIVDATANIEEKHRQDTRIYLVKQLNRIRESFMLLRILLPHPSEKFAATADNLTPLIRLYMREHVKMRNLEELKEFFYFVKEDIEDSVSAESQSGYTLDVVTQRMSSQPRILIRKMDDWESEWKQECLRALKIWETTENTLRQDPTLSNYINSSIDRLLNLEFNKQIQPASPAIMEQIQESSIRLTKDEDVYFDIKISENSVVSSSSTYIRSPFWQAYFIDDPCVVEDYPRGRSEYFFDEEPEQFNYSQIASHRDRLRLIMHTQSEPQNIIEANALVHSLQQIMEKINDIVPGEFQYDPNGVYYVTEDCKLNVGNLATGSKVFSIVKKLLISGLLDESTLLILDEPESHLHPDWINKLAEIVVVLVKELGVHILLTTHSPNFLLAIDSFMRTYNIQDKCNFYQTCKTNDGKQIAYQNVTACIEQIYADFAKSFSEMNALRKQSIMSEVE